MEDGVTLNNPIGIRHRECVVQTLPNESISRGWVETTPFELVADRVQNWAVGWCRTALTMGMDLE